MRFDLGEFSGSLGDLGTFIPLVAAMSIVSGMDIGAILLFAGLFNIVTGILFGLPIPVQPMKAIAAVAIAEGLAPAETAAAGLLAGAITIILGATRMTDRIESIIPRAVVRGIQLGIGAKLFINGIKFISDSPAWGPDSIVLAVVSATLVGLTIRYSKLPTALFLFGIGLVLIFVTDPNSIDHLSMGLVDLQMIVPNSHDWLNGLLYGTVPQLPLTLLNSIIAVCVLSGDLFPGRMVPSGRMAISVGAMNLIGCWFGSMPLCHGSGGLAGQYRFGARTGGSVVMLGLSKLIIGMFFGASAMWMLNAYPLSILGVMLLFAGMELARPAWEKCSGTAFLVAVVTGAGIVLFNTMAGFLAGVIFYMILRTMTPRPAAS